ncbi:MAG: hypothetical protein HYW50_00815 [Candidatus Diapherotrites archaeon]|nr:hypothetical protein [Candidatus Diapherotrites archaeon]
MKKFENFLKRERILPNIMYLSQCLERGGKNLADSDIGFAKNALNFNK